MLKFENQSTQESCCNVLQSKLERQLHEIIDGAEQLKRSIELEMYHFDLGDYTSETDFIEHLDQCYDPVKICGYEYSPGRLLQKVDYTAFREEFNNWIDTLDKSDNVKYAALESDLEKIEEYLDKLMELKNDN